MDTAASREGAWRAALVERRELARRKPLDAELSLDAELERRAVELEARSAALDERREQLRATLPIRRVVGPEDVAALAVHIMVNTALTGATFDVDGGQQLT